MSNEKRVRDNPIVGDFIDLIEMVSDFDGNLVPMKSSIRVVAVNEKRVWYKEYGRDHYLVSLLEWQRRLDSASEIKMVSDLIAGVFKEISATDLIARERKRQIEKGWTIKHDDAHNQQELPIVAACYALPPKERNRKIWDETLVEKLFPWIKRDWKPTPDDRIRELVRAGALIVAEIERLQREPSL